MTNSGPKMSSLINPHSIGLEGPTRAHGLVERGRWLHVRASPLNPRLHTPRGGPNAALYHRSGALRPSESALCIVHRSWLMLLLAPNTATPRRARTRARVCTRPQTPFADLNPARADLPCSQALAGRAAAGAALLLVPARLVARARRKRGAAGVAPDVLLGLLRRYGAGGAGGGAERAQALWQGRAHRAAAVQCDQQAARSRSGEFARYTP